MYNHEQLSGRPLRVLYVLNDMGGGASMGIYEMLRALPHGCLTAYAVAPPGPSQNAGRMPSVFSGLRNFPIPWWNISPELGITRRAAIACSLWMRGISQQRCADQIHKAIADWNIDLVHSATSLTLGGAVAAKSARTPHLWHIKESIGRCHRVQFTLPDSELVNFISSYSRIVVAMSEFVADIFRQHHCSNLEILPDGVDVAPFANASTRHLRTRLALSADVPLIGMVAGPVSKWKQHAIFIRAAALVSRQHPSSRFVILGQQPRAQRWPYDANFRYHQELQRLVHELKLTDRLQFLDFEPDAPDFMRSLDVLVHPCSHEPFGRVAIEAMAAATPVVGPNTGGIAEIVVDGETGILAQAGQPESFAQSINRLITDANLRRQLGQASRIRSRQVFSVETHAHRQFELYQRILKIGNLRASGVAALVA